ncbi:histidine kinase [Dactylosporangium sp. NPDC051485]|uniref:sensor histidine kinase n=1 Tax=Dactylosporangium sp. NPDC051485 TaxID=3154846 RepID=UPI003445162D
MDSTAGGRGIGRLPGRVWSALCHVLITGRDRDLPPSGWGTAGRRYAQRTLLAVAVAALFAGEVSNGYLHDHAGPVVAVVVLLHMTPVFLMRRWPFTAWRLAVVGTLLTLVVAAILTDGGQRYQLGTPWTPGMLLYLPVVMMTVARCPQPGATAVAGVSLLLVVPAGLVVGAGPLSGAAVSGILAVGAATLAGLGLGRQDRMEQQLDVVNRSVAEEQTRRAVLEERARIVGELHDIVAHHLSLIAVRTETAPYRLAALRSAPKDDPVRAELAAMGDATRQALNETRQLLGVLRRDEAESDDLAPQPGLNDVEALVADVRAVGGPATLTVHGHPRPVPPTVGLVLYRVAQEALSNARRHSPGAPVRVELWYAVDRVRIRVENSPPPRPVRSAAGPGLGLAGMRERMAVVRGELAVEPRPDGGFTVDAAVPVTTARTGAPALW